MQYVRHMMRAHQSLEKDIILGITAQARKKGKPCMWWMDDIKSCNWTLSKWLKIVSERKEKMALISQEEKTDQCLIQGESNGKPLLWECCLVHPKGSSGFLQTRQTSWPLWNDKIRSHNPLVLAALLFQDKGNVYWIPTIYQFPATN